MVTSNFVSMACYVNMITMALLLILGLLPASVNTEKFMNALRITLYSGGIVYNLFVFLQAERKLESIVKTMKNYRLYVDRVKQELDVYKHSVRSYMENLWDLFKDSTSSFSKFSKPSRSTQKYERVSKRQGFPKESFQSPDLNSTYYLKPLIKAHSDPTKKIETTRKDLSRRLRAQSPELFKNKIYKSRMHLGSSIEY
jgi:sRNA-binding regulator protein Hfq